MCHKYYFPLNTLEKKLNIALYLQKVPVHKWTDLLLGRVIIGYRHLKLT